MILNTHSQLLLTYEVNELFGSHSKTLTDKIISFDKTKSDCKLISNTFFSTSLIISLYSWNPGFLIGGALSLCVSLFYRTYSVQVNKDKIHAELLLKKCDQVTHFHAAFKDFEINPKDAKIKNLFDKFLALRQGPIWSRIVELKLIDGFNLTLFHSDGSIFLMDAAATFLEAKNPDSIISKQWQRLLNASVMEIDNLKEPWESNGLERPDFNCYQHFFKNNKSLKSIDLAEQIITIFKNALEKAIQTNSF